MADSHSELRLVNGAQRLFVDGKPFLLLGLQLNCDSCYNPRDIDVLFRNAKKMGCNTVCPLLYWNLIEPEEGKYDFSILASMLRSAETYDLRIQLDWFGSYKNACMAYAPEWVKNDTARFRRVATTDGVEVPNCACYNCEETRDRDGDAVERVFEYLRDHDTTGRVILFQVNNETGILGDRRCHCPVCNEKFVSGGYAEKYGARADEVFSAESILAFQEDIARRAKAIYSMPCYMNAWLAQPWKPAVPGTTYPSGGPVAPVLDVYFAKKKYVDFVSPDIYTPSILNFARVCRDYKSPVNPLFIPECATGRVSRSWKNVIYAIGEWGSIGYDPWAIDCCYTNEAPCLADPPLCDRVTEKWNDEAYQLQASYELVSCAMESLVMNQDTPNLGCWVQEEGDNKGFVAFDDGITVSLDYMDPNAGRSRGFVIRLSKDEFLISGMGCRVTFYSGEKPVSLSRAEFVRMNGSRMETIGLHSVSHGAKGRFSLNQKDPGASYAKLIL